MNMVFNQSIVKESLVRESLFNFVTNNLPSVDLANVDEIGLAYLISIIEESMQDDCFDVENFIDLMTAYVPAFASLNPEVVCSWVVNLESDIGNRLTQDEARSNEGSKIDLTIQNLSDIVPPAVKTKRSPSSSESSESPTIVSETLQELTEQCNALAEMFPNTCTMEIKHCVSIASGDLERAAATLLYRSEHGEAIVASAPPPQPRGVADDREVNRRIVERYSYIDREADLREHKPIAPKNEPKKLVRYRDNKIVSLKGERYTEVSKGGIEEDCLRKQKKHYP